MDVNFSENLFLEVKELNRFKKSIVDNGYKRLFQNLIKRYGIAQNADNAFFKVSKKDGEESVIINRGIAFDSDLNAIVLNDTKKIDVSSVSSKSWIVISYAETHDEVGTVDVSEVGVLVGHDTKFTEVLRSGMYPVRVSFTSDKNKYDYEVQSVTSDNSAVISGSFVAENNLKYQVIGTFTPGFQPNDNNKHIYTYDDCAVQVIQSDNKPNLDDKHFLLCSIDREIATNSIVIVDYRYSNVLSTENNAINAENNSANTEIKNISNLLSATVTGSNELGFSLELILEHGYKIDKFEFITTSSSNIINVLKGTCNYIENINIPDNFFSGYIILNRKNMKRAKILKNSKAQLFLSNFDSELISGDDVDLILIPDYSEIEFEIKVSGSIEMADIPFYFRRRISSFCRTRNSFDIFYDYGIKDKNPEVNVKIRYHYIDAKGNETVFKDLNICSYYPIDGGYRTLSGSSFDITIDNIKPKEKIRNYS